MQGKFLCGQAVTADSILPILSNIEQDYKAASAEIGAEDEDEKYAITPVIFKSPDKVIPLLDYWAVFLALMKPVVNKSKLDYLLCSRRNYTPVANSFEDSVADITTNGSKFMEDNARAYDALIPGIFGTLVE